MATTASQGVEEEAPSGGITEGVGQLMQGIQIFQDLEALEPPAFQGVEEEAPSGGITEEAGQPMQGV